MNVEHRPIESAPTIKVRTAVLTTERKELPYGSLCTLYSPVANCHTQETLTALYPNQPIAMPRQIHGVEVRYVDQSSDQVIEGCDGLITDDPSVVLGARGADCPLVIATAGRIRGIMHSGWRGTLLGAPGALISAMGQQGVEAEEISVYISPGIRQCCYAIPLDDVPHDRIHRFEKEYPEIAVVRRNTHIYINLQRAIRESLYREKVPLEQITIDPRCTCCHPVDNRSTTTPFPSSRREGDSRTEGLVATIADTSFGGESHAAK